MVFNYYEPKGPSSQYICITQTFIWWEKSDDWIVVGDLMFIIALVLFQSSHLCMEWQKLNLPHGQILLEFLFV